MSQTPEPAGALLREQSELLLRGKIFDVVAAHLTLPSGRRQDLWIVEHPGAVAIAAVTDARELVLVRQYRHAARETLIEVPAGRLEPGERPFDAARRELAEEAGLAALDWRVLTTFLPAPGFCSERITLFEARALSSVPAHPDADEELEVLTLAPEQVFAVARDAKTLLATAWLLLGR